MTFDLVVIGGGAAGLAAAITAAGHGASVALVHDGPLGGDCTLTGCVPSKALLGAAARRASFTDAMATVRQAVATVTRREVDDIAAQRRITLVPGRARFRSPRAVDGTMLTAERFVLATGSRPMVAPVDGLDRSGYLTTGRRFSLDRPGAAARAGGGADRLRAGPGVRAPRVADEPGRDRRPGAPRRGA